MARSLWSGSLSFGLVNIPVALHSGVRDQDVHFHQLERKTKARVELRRVCSKEDVEVELDEIGHGYDVGKKQVVLSDEELERLAPERTRTIDIEAFVHPGEIAPEYHDHPYLLVPQEGEGAARAYRLLADVMAKGDRVALGRFVLRSREYLVVIRGEDHRLSLTTLLFADELRDPKDLGDGRVTAKDRPSVAAVKRTTQLLRALQTDFDPDAYEDRHRERVERLIARKRKGQKLTGPDDDERGGDGEAEKPEAAPDLMAALKASLERV